MKIIYVFDMALCVTQLLQSWNNDIADGVHMIDSLKYLDTALQNDIDTYYNKQYVEALLRAKSVHVPEAKPRTCRKQQHRPVSQYKSLRRKEEYIREIYKLYIII